MSELGHSCKLSCELSARVKPTLSDVKVALIDMGMYICLVVLLHTNVTYHITCSPLFELITYFLFDVSLERFNITIPQEINIYSVVLIPICKMHSKQPCKSCSLVLTCKIQAELTTCSTKKSHVYFLVWLFCFVCRCRSWFFTIVWKASKSDSCQQP